MVGYKLERALFMTPYEQAVNKFTGKNILIFGLGLLGGASGDARFFSSLGAHVRVTDQKSKGELQATINQLIGIPLEYSLGGHDKKDIEWAEYIVRNPAIPIDHPLIQYARQLGKRIVMRSALFIELAGIFTIGVTGTRGKTTTTTMIYEMVKTCSGKKTLLCGNIAGISDLELLHTITDPSNTIAVMELSSWQLQGFGESNIAPNIAVLTNLYPDHLNKYPNLADYYADKKIILTNQHPQDSVVLNSDVPEFHDWARTAVSSVYWYSSTDIPKQINLIIQGEHNRANAAAALKVGKILGYPSTMTEQIIYSFKGVPFRLEAVACKSKITYVNDTTSTTPIATVKALLTINKPILICGGSDKNLPLDEMIISLNKNTKGIILLTGNGTDRIKPHLHPELIIGTVDSMAKAVSLAAKNARPGDVVLLSPGFTSFGLFTNEFDRGNQFNQCVQRLS